MGGALWSLDCVYGKSVAVQQTYFVKREAGRLACRADQIKALQSYRTLRFLMIS